MFIQVAKRVRTVPVRGFGAEERFDAEDCDLENCAFPHPLTTPILRNMVKGLKLNEKATKNEFCNCGGGALMSAFTCLRAFIHLAKPGRDTLGCQIPGLMEIPMPCIHNKAYTG